MGENDSNRLSLVRVAWCLARILLFVIAAFCFSAASSEFIYIDF